MLHSQLATHELLVIFMQCIELYKTMLGIWQRCNNSLSPTHTSVERDAMSSLVTVASVQSDALWMGSQGDRAPLRTTFKHIVLRN